MNKMLLVLMLGCFFMAGCSLLDKAAPAQYDASGKEIPGSRVPTEFTKAVADTVPYGNVALNLILLLTTVAAVYKQKKTETGLIATLKAGQQAAADPATAEAWEKLKQVYADAHNSAGLTGYINELLAKIKTTA